MPWSLRVITGLTADTEPSLVLKFDAPPAKYIFNVPEGVTRACIQKRFGIAKTKAAFLTRIHPEQIGGFPGVVMMLADMDSRDLTVCGPPGLTHYVASTRFYSRRTNFGVFVKEYKSQEPAAAGNATLPPPIFQDENIVVHSIPLYPSACEDEGSNTITSGLGKRKLLGSATPPPFPKRRSTESSPASAQPLDIDSPPSISVDEADRIHRERILSMMFRPPASNSDATPAADDAELDKMADSIPASPSKSSGFGHIWNQRLPVYRGDPQTLAYFVVGPATRGKFDAQRAKELGVVGPMCGKLTKGETVTTPNGNVVTPDMCIGPSTPPPAFLFVHVPDPTYIDSVILRSKSGRFLPSTYGEDIQLHGIVHRVGPGVLEDRRYREWMSSFDAAVNHMVSSERYSPNQIAYWSSTKMQLELSYLDKDIFRLPSHNEVPSAALTTLPDLPPKTSVLVPDTELSFHPKLDLAPASFVPPNDFKATLESIDAGSFVHPLADDYKAAREAAEKSAENQRSPEPTVDDVTIMTLGTGSAMPSKYRNVSSTLIQIPKYGSVLLDAGEGTWGQLARQFGSPNISEDGEVSGGVVDLLRELKCIFISHVHGDHHMGLAKILARRHQLDPPPSEPLFLVAGRMTLQYLAELNDVIDFGLHDRRHIYTINSADLHYRSSASEPVMLRATLGLDSLRTVDVEHRIQCSGLVLRHKDGWSAVYSGDTMPCSRLVEAGQNATVLIHEATMADDQVDLALAKAHSTAGQAIDVGKRMNAKNILLTHFSQRYPKMPELQAPDESLISSEEYRAPIAIAFDCATLKLGSLWKMEKYMGAMGKTFEMEPADDISDGGVAAEESSIPAVQAATSTKNKKNKKEKRTGAKAT